MGISQENTIALMSKREANVRLVAKVEISAMPQLEECDATTSGRGTIKDTMEEDGWKRR